VLDITKSLAYHGFKKIILLNGHGSNWPNSIWSRGAQPRNRRRVRPVCWWSLLTVDKNFLRAGDKANSWRLRSACDWKLVIHVLDGDNVRKDQIKNGTISFNEDNSPFSLGRFVWRRSGNHNLLDEQLFRNRRPCEPELATAEKASEPTTRRQSN